MPDEPQDVRTRVTILSVGVWNYQNMLRLTGPEKDLQNIKSILVDDPTLALFESRQYRELPNPTSEELRKKINQFVLDRGGDNDILIFYFSGHGRPIGSSDFAFCTKDTASLPGEDIILPMTAVSFTEILRTLWIRKITPIFIIDACFGGAAGGALIVNSDQLIDELQGEVQKRYGSSYALFCSAPNDEQIRDRMDGSDSGFLSNCLVEIAKEGLGKRNRKAPTILLSELYQSLLNKVAVWGIEPSPILLLGASLPAISIFKNVSLSPLKYRLQPHLLKVLYALWNGGNPVELRPSEIDNVTGSKGAYGNHKKFNLSPWNLVETIGGRRRLNDRGIAFMEGKLRLPRDIISPDRSTVYTDKEGTDMAGIEDFPKE